MMFRLSLRLALCLYCLAVGPLGAAAAVPGEAWASGPGNKPAFTVMLAPAIPQSRPAAAAHGVFFRRRIPVLVPSLEPGEQLLLAGRSDGGGAIRCDDQFVLLIQPADGPPRRFQLDFGRMNGSGVASSGPVSLAGLIPSGRVTLEVRLVDRLPPVYSSSAFFLVIKRGIASSRSAEGPASRGARSPAHRWSPPQPTPGATATPAPTPPPPRHTQKAHSDLWSELRAMGWRLLLLGVVAICLLAFQGSLVRLFSGQVRAGMDVEARRSRRF